ncbi:hypothetical protein MICRO116_230031 [Micrococcus sp. 116]|nr:hypothetical protein MICRO116_230031 [Micrococcus sp. 116]
MRSTLVRPGRRRRAAARPLPRIPG